MNNNDKVTPWKGNDGKNKDPKTLREESKSWDGSTWEAYLDSFETKQREDLFLKNPRHIEEIEIRNLAELTFSLSKHQKHPRLRGALEGALGRLKRKEMLVLKGHYWEGKSFVEIAKELDLSPSSVSMIHKRVLPKLKSILTREILDQYAQHVDYFEGLEKDQVSAEI